MCVPGQMSLLGLTLHTEMLCVSDANTGFAPGKEGSPKWIVKTGAEVTGRQVLLRWLYEV